MIASRVAGLARAGDVIGAGSGSTSFLTVLALGERATKGLSIAVVPTSVEIELACHASGLQVLSDVPAVIDWCFDGADEVDPLGRLIKGRGGALHRERHVFDVARKRYVVADSSKSVDQLGCKFAVPVEVDPRMLRVAYGHLSGLEQAVSVNLRFGGGKDGPIFTESGRVMLDVQLADIEVSLEHAIKQVPGVCCTGIFSGYAFARVLEEGLDERFL